MRKHEVALGLGRDGIIIADYDNDGENDFFYDNDLGAGWDYYARTYATGSPGMVDGGTVAAEVNFMRAARRMLLKTPSKCSLFNVTPHYSASSMPAAVKSLRRASGVFRGAASASCRAFSAASVAFRKAVWFV